MPDGFSILAFLGSIKTAKEAAALILDASKSREKAELEYKIAGLTKTLTELENQAQNFEKLIQAKDTEIERLKTSFETTQLPQISDLPKECIEILKSFNKTSDEVEIWEIADYLQISEQKIEYFLKKLVKLELVDIYYYVGKSTYSLSDMGREYLFNNNLLE